MDHPAKIFRLAALLFAAALAGCGRETPSLSAEAEDSSYREGQQLEKEGRTDEALADYLKVIARRGDAAPESHLSAGNIYLTHIKDPIAAIYHFRKFVELEPNAMRSQYVRGQIDAAKRQFALTLPGQPLENQSERLGYQEQISNLQRENEELKAEVSALRSGVSAPSAFHAAAADSPISFAPVAPSSADSPPVLREAPVAAAPEPSPVSAAPLAPAPQARPAPAAAGSRRHVVVRGDTLFSLAQKYYGSRSRWREILAANREVLSRENTPLKIGMTLKIP